jgi:hypothetical protein
MHVRGGSRHSVSSEDVADEAGAATQVRGLGTRRAGQLSRCPKAMSEADRYTPDVRARSERHHPRPWSQEICRTTNRFSSAPSRRGVRDETCPARSRTNPT